MTARQTEMRVGLFVMASILVGGTTAFVIGQQRNFFDEFIEYRAQFRDVEGLRKGSTVRLAGITVGTVTDVAFNPQGEVEIVFQVAERYVSRIRGNPRAIPDPADAAVPQPTRVSIGSKGMLGDKLLDLSLGDSRLPLWPHDRPLPSNAGGGDLMATAGRVMGAVEGTAQNLQSATAPFADQQFSHDLETTASNLARLSTDLAQGDGTIARLIRDPEMGREVQETLTNLRSLSAELAQTSRSIRAISDEIRAGDGSAHRLIYGPETADAAGHIGDAAGEVALALHAIREGDGTAHRLIYENDGAQMIENLTAASADAAHVMHEIRAGHGTIGGLIVDPSIYEDVKRLVGDLERNDILRALVRYSIRRDEATSDTRVRESPVAPSGETTVVPMETTP